MRFPAKVGDRVTRMLAGTVPMELTVVRIDDKLIYCGPPWQEGQDVTTYPGWKFDSTYGYEVDPELGWGVPGPDGAINTGSYLIFPGEES